MGSWTTYTFKDASGTTQTLYAWLEGSDLFPGTVPAPLPAEASKGGVTSSGSSQQLVAADSARRLLIVSNGSSSGVYLEVGSGSAVQGQGIYLPSKSTMPLATTARVAVIYESGGAAGPVGYTAW